jgi:hypothetical protein
VKTNLTLPGFHPIHLIFMKNKSRFRSDGGIIGKSKEIPEGYFMVISTNHNIKVQL